MFRRSPSRLRATHWVRATVLCAAVIAVVLAIVRERPSGVTGRHFGAGHTLDEPREVTPADAVASLHREPQDAAAAVATAVVRVQVAAAESGQPIASAAIELFVGDPREPYSRAIESWQTDVRGCLTCRVPLGSPVHALRCSAPSRMPQTQLLSELTQAADRASDLVLRVSLERAGRLRGRVVDGEARGVAGVLVRVDGNDLEFAARPVRSDADGCFELQPLAPGSRARAIASWSVPDAGKSEFVTIEPCGSLGEPFVTIAVERGGRLAGRVMRDSGDPVAGAVVVALLENGRLVPQSRFTSSDAQGAFTFEALPSGTYVIEARVSSAAVRVAPVMIVEGRDQAGLTIRLPAGRDITGRVRVEPPPALDDAQLRSAGGVSLVLADLGVEETTREDGSFCFEGVPEGMHRLGLAGDHARNVALALDMQVWAGQLDVDVVLVPASARVEGEVLIASATPDEAITLSLLDRNDLVVWTAASASGPFATSLVPPGKYRLRVRSPGCECFESAWLVLDAAEVKRGLTIALAIAPTLNGWVCDRAGHPLPGAFVSVLDDDVPESASTDVQGQFAVAIPQRPAWLRVQHGAHATRYLRVNDPLPTMLQAIELDRGTRVTGRVVSMRGSGLAGVRVRLSAPEAPQGEWLEIATDPGGGFAFEHVPRGGHELSVVGTGGCVARTQTIDVALEPLALADIHVRE